jgi:hypothetical protein
LPGEIQVVTVKTRNAAIELPARFSREEEFVTPLSREIGNLCVLPEHRRKAWHVALSNTPRPGAMSRVDQRYP